MFVSGFFQLRKIWLCWHTYTHIHTLEWRKWVLGAICHLCGGGGSEEIMQQTKRSTSLWNTLAQLAQPDVSPLWIAVAENPRKKTGKFVHLTVLYGYASSVKSNSSVGNTVRPAVGRIKWFVHFYIKFPLITNIPPSSQRDYRYLCCSD